MQHSLLAPDVIVMDMKMTPLGMWVFFSFHVYDISGAFLSPLVK